MKHSHTPFLVLAVFITVTVGALYWYMYYATSSSVNRAILARDIVLTEKADQAQAKTLAALADKTAADRGKLAKFFVPADDVVVFITILESIGAQSGSAVTLSSISGDPLAGAAPGTIGAVHAHIDATGSWQSVMRAISLAEQLPYAVSLSHVRLSTSSIDPKGKNTWNASFDIQASTII